MTLPTDIDKLIKELRHDAEEDAVLERFTPYADDTEKRLREAITRELAAK